MKEDQQQQQDAWARSGPAGLPNFVDVLHRKTRPPFDLFKFYLFLQREGAENILDFWLDVQQHENICRAYFKDIRKSGCTIRDDWPEYWEYARRRGSIYGTVVVTQTDAKHSTASTAEIITEMQEKRGAAGRSPSPDARVPTIIPRPPITRSDLVTSAERIFLRYLSPAGMYPNAGESHEIYLPPALRVHSFPFPLGNATSGAADRAALAQVPDMFHAQKEYCFCAMEQDAFPRFLRSNAFRNLTLMSALVRSTLVRFGSKLLRIGSGKEDDDEHPQRSPYRLRRNSDLLNALYGDDSLNGSRSSLDTIGPQRPHSPSPSRSPSPSFTLRRNDGLRNTSPDDDSLILGSSSSLDTIGPQRPQHSPPPYPYPYPYPTLQRNDGLRNTSDDDDSLIGGSSSTLNMVFSGVPYPSSTALQSNGDLSNASFMTTPSDN